LTGERRLGLGPTWPEAIPEAGDHGTTVPQPNHGACATVKGEGDVDGRALVDGALRW